MTSTASSRQEPIKNFWLHFWAADMASISIIYLCNPIKIFLGRSCPVAHNVTKWHKHKQQCLHEAQENTQKKTYVTLERAVVIVLMCYHQFLVTNIHLFRFALITTASYNIWKHCYHDCQPLSSICFQYKTKGLLLGCWLAYNTKGLCCCFLFQ